MFGVFVMSIKIIFYFPKIIIMAAPALDANLLYLSDHNNMPFGLVSVITQNAVGWICWSQLSRLQYGTSPVKTAPVKTAPPKQPQTKTAPNQNIPKPKHPQTKTSPS